MNKSFAGALLLLALFVGFATCASADVVWNLNATFADGLTATGTFTTTGGSSSVNPTFVSWDVTFAGGTLAHDFVDSSTTAPPGAILTEIPGGAPEPAGTVEELGFANEPGFDPYVDFYLSTYITDAGGSMTMVGAQSCDGTCYGLNPDHPHTLASQTPEPSAIVLFGTVTCILGAAFRRRKRTKFIQGSAGA